MQHSHDFQVFVPKRQAKQESFSVRSTFRNKHDVKRDMAPARNGQIFANT